MRSWATMNIMPFATTQKAESITENFYENIAIKITANTSPFYGTIRMKTKEIKLFAGFNACPFLENLAIETLLKGPELALKGAQSFFDTDKNERRDFRVKWWKPGLKTLGDAAMIPDNALLEYRNDPLTEYAGNTSIMCYPTDAPPVIFGHYSRKTFGLNAACLDYGIIKGNELAALRWHRSEKDRPLSEMEIVTVQFNEKK